MGRKASFVPKPRPGPKPHYLVVNADESEPGTFKDREIIARVPHRLIEGCLITAHAIESQDVFIYIRGEYLDRVRDPARRARRGRATAGAPRRRRPSSCTAAPARTSAARRRRCSTRSRASAASRARGRRSRRSQGSTPSPTADQQRRDDRHRARRSSRWARPSTRRSAPRTRPARALFSLSGNVERARQLRARARHDAARADLRPLGGGIPDGRELKAVIPGGSSVPVLTPRRARHAARLRLAGRSRARSFGSAARDRRRRPLLHGAARPPRREVLHARVVRQVHAVPRGHALDGADPRAARGRRRAEQPSSTCCSTSCDRILGKCLCPLGDSAADAGARATCDKFRDEFEAHVDGGGCPFGGESSLEGIVAPVDQHCAPPRLSRSPRVSAARARHARPVDGRRGRQVPKGTGLVEAALAAGIEIPVFCYEPRLGAAGRRLPHVPLRGRARAAEAAGRVHADRRRRAWRSRPRSPPRRRPRGRTRRSSSSSSTTRSTARSATRAASARCRT